MLESWWQRQKPLPVETSLELWPEVWCFIKAVAKGLCIDMACLPEVPLWLVPEVLPFHARAASCTSAYEGSVLVQFRAVPAKFAALVLKQQLMVPVGIALCRARGHWHA